MDKEDLLVDTCSPDSSCIAVLEDDGTCAWLYLMLQNSYEIVASVCVHNRVPPPFKDEVQAYRDKPPPAAIEYAGETARCDMPENYAWSFVWSNDSASVALLKNDTPVAFIVDAQRPGYSRELLQDGPRGKVWSDEIYSKTFDIAS